MKSLSSGSSPSPLDVQAFFPGENVENLPITFAFGEPVNTGLFQLEMSTSFNGEESMTGVNGGYDTGG